MMEPWLVLFLVGCGLLFVGATGRVSPVGGLLTLLGRFVDESADRPNRAGVRKPLSKWERLCCVISGGLLLPFAFVIVRDDSTGETQRDIDEGQVADDERDAESPCPPVSPDKFEVGEYYLREPGDEILSQVVNPHDLSRDWDGRALWIDLEGKPIPNPLIGLPPSIIDVVRDFGSAEAVVDYNRCQLRPYAEVFR
jgi:hypothetical protein